MDCELTLSSVNHQRPTESDSGSSIHLDATEVAVPSGTNGGGSTGCRDSAADRLLNLELTIASPEFPKGPKGSGTLAGLVPAEVCAAAAAVLVGSSSATSPLGKLSLAMWSVDV
ncbi:hypothetical protein BHE74_00052783 [Ensete ventricosum]|nr:hypothetical protein BHE74_00052783 [Ensete ventricosum]